MKFKVISDLHIDINRDYQRYMKFDPDSFYLIAGDISGDRFQTTDFLISKDIQGAFVEGNHFGYNRTGTSPKEDTKEASNQHLIKTFDSNFQLTFLENTTIAVEDCVIIGCTLYTDFNLFETQERAMERAWFGMNDFRYVTTQEGNTVRKVTPSDYLVWHKQSMKYITKMCEKYKNRKIVILTHHAPSIQSVSPIYVTDSLTPAYATNLEQFIKDRPQIKLFVHGHIHSYSNYKIGECQVIANPFGYYNELNMDLNEYLGEEVEV